MPLSIPSKRGTPPWKKETSAGSPSNSSPTTRSDGYSRLMAAIQSRQNRRGT